MPERPPLNSIPDPALNASALDDAEFDSSTRARRRVLIGTVICATIIEAVSQIIRRLQLAPDMYPGVLTTISALMLISLAYYLIWRNYSARLVRVLLIVAALIIVAWTVTDNIIRHVGNDTMAGVPYLLPLIHVAYSFVTAAFFGCVMLAFMGSLFHAQDLNRLLVKNQQSLVQEVADRKRAEEALRKSEQQFSRAFLSSPAVSSIARVSDGQIIEVNYAFQRILGYRRDEVIGRTSFEIGLWAHPDDRVRLASKLLAAKTLQDVQLSLRKKNGDIAFFHGSGEVIELEGEPCILAVGEDITERHRAEEERQHLEAQVQHAQKLESLGVLAGGIAHDFNNILLVILGNADLALNAMSEISPARRCIQEIEHAARRAAELTRQMLAYSGKGRFEIRALDVNETVDEMVPFLEASISKKAALHMKLTRGLPAIRADVAQIQQIVMNLIVNASEALDEERGGDVRVRTGIEMCSQEYLAQSRLPDKAAAGRYVFLEISDTGCGMSNLTKERLFDPFFSTKFTGRGLGMSAVLGIVRGHKGAILVESELGKGTTIRVLFPALDETSAISDRGQNVSTDKWMGSGMILLVDDEEAILSVTQRLLKYLGFEVITAADGVEAIEIFQSRSQDIACVLLDMSMPRMDGEQAFRELRQIKENCRVILASGYAEQELEERFAGQGIGAFIQKPYDLKTLSEKLQLVLGSGKAEKDGRDGKD